MMKRGGLGEQEINRYLNELATAEVARAHKLEPEWNFQLRRFVRKSGTDYAGTLAPAGRSIWFEAKESAKAKFDTAEVDSHQRAVMASHAALGAVTFVLVRCNCPGDLYGTWFALPNDDRVLVGKRPWAELLPYRLKDGCRFLEGYAK